MIDVASVPEAHRDTVQAALADAFPAGDVDSLVPGPSGASGALTYRVVRPAGDHLLRIEGTRIPGRNPHQYANLRAAADAGIAPPVRLADDERGVLVMQWLETQPLPSYPGGPVALLDAVGELIARLQELDPFPAMDDWFTMVGRMLQYVQDIGRYAPGVLDDHVAGYERIKESWHRDPDQFVAAHNDPNASNILFDGERLWLVDWETSSPNDPVVDLAVAANQLAPVQPMRDALLAAWRGSPPDDLLRARLTLAQLSTQLFAACAISMVTHDPGSEPETDLDAPSPEDFQEQVINGTLAMGTPETMTTFAKVVLAQYLAVVRSDDFERALRIAGGG